MAVVAAAGVASLAWSADTFARAAHWSLPSSADQLIVVSSPTTRPAPPGYLATLRAYERVNASAPWRRVFGPWRVETGWGHLLPSSRRREGDGATPTGVFGLGTTIYGTRPDPGGLHYAYHRLVCGDWWDEDPYSRLYNEFVHVPCGETPSLASRSEPLWTETAAYPYLAVVRFNMNPTRGGPAAPGSGIFLHRWVGGATNGCVAVHERPLLRILRWLSPSAHPVIELGTTGEVRPRG